MLLLRLTDERRLPGKGLLKMAEKLGYARSIPHAAPVSQVWMIHSSFDAHVLSRAHQHISSRSHIYHRRLLWIGLGNPYLDREAICCSSKVDRQRSGDREQQR